MTIPQEQSSIQQEQDEQMIRRTLRDGEYHVRRLLGKGGGGNVYLALHTALAVPLALKRMPADSALPEVVISELDAALRENGTVQHQVPLEVTEKPVMPTSGGEHTDRFIREALFLARLHHPAIPTLYDYFFQDGYWYLAMDYIPGSSLSTYLRRCQALSPLEALAYALQICEVLDYLHRRNPPVFYRDLKPANIIVRPDSTVMLIDFGTTCYAGELADDKQRAALDTGSPGYIAPEQLRNDGLLDGRIDLFGLGIILYEMLSGRSPREHMGLEALHVINPTISNTLSGLVKLATRPDPRLRFQSAYTFYLALERAYNIEERSAYEQRVLSVVGPPPAGKPSEVAVIDDVEERAALLALRKLTGGALPVGASALEQRRALRQALAQNRQERLVQDQLESQLAIVDEGLMRRSLSQTSIQTQVPPKQKTSAIAKEVGSAGLQQVGRQNTSGGVRVGSHTGVASAHRWSRFLLFLFFLTLIVCIVLALGWFYVQEGGYYPGQQVPRPVHTAEDQPRAKLLEEPVVADESVTSEPAPKEIAWRSLPSPPEPGADHAATYVELDGRSYIYMSGGYRGDPVTPSTSEADELSRYDPHLYRYDIEAARWEIIADQFPLMINNAVAVDEKKQLFFTAGYVPDKKEVQSILYTYDPASEVLRPITPAPSISFGFAGGLLADQQGHLYVTQGFMTPGEAETRAGTGWYRYDIAANSWETLAPLPKGLGYAHVSFGKQGQILLFGGAVDAGQVSQSQDIYRYDISTDSWTRLSQPLPGPISGMVGCTVTPDQIVIAGGYDSSHHGGTEKVWLFDIRTEAWQALPDFPPGGLFLGTAACDGQGHFYLSRGAGDSQKPTRDFWLLTLPPVRTEE